jgi:hypothetical protein
MRISRYLCVPALLAGTAWPGHSIMIENPNAAGYLTGASGWQVTFQTASATATIGTSESFLDTNPDDADEELPLVGRNSFRYTGYENPTYLGLGTWVNRELLPEPVTWDLVLGAGLLLLGIRWRARRP